MTEVGSGYDREEHERQRAAALSLRARIEAEAATQRQTHEFARNEQRFADDAERLSRIDGALRDGTPVENMSTRDIQFLIGSEDKKRLWNTFGSTRRARWQKAIEAMPSPPAHASEHVTTTYLRHLERVHVRKQETVRGLPKQAGRWYFELCRREVVRTLLNHVPTCSRHCAREEWSFILDMPSYMPDETEFDPAGNFKPTATKKDATDEDELPDPAASASSPAENPPDTRE